MTAANILNWQVAGRTLPMGDVTRIMGIVNVTPDSFSDGGKWSTTEAAVEHGLQLVAEGADILDIGGESTRPGADPVGEQDELDRVLPVVKQLANQVQVPISIDTMKAKVAAAALQAGATIINDVSAGTFDADMSRVAADSDCGVILMHMLGTPQTMQNEPHYDNVVREICDYLQQRTDRFEQAGVAPQRIMVDPGVGFGKTAEHNFEILSNIAAFRRLGRPVLIGHSRKRFLQKLLGLDLEERLAGTIGVSVALAEQQTDLIRVHDVAANRDAITAWRTIRAAVQPQQHPTA